MGGIHVRAGTKFIEDCPLAAAWWRRHLIESIASELEKEGLDPDRAHELLCMSGVWPKLRGRVQESLTVLLAPNALIAVLLHLDDMDKAGVAELGPEVDKATRELGRMATRITPHLFSARDMQNWI